MAATFARETAKIEEYYVRRPGPGGTQKIIRRPFNLVTYDNGEQYVEPVNYSQGAYTWSDFNTDATDAEFRIEDNDPFPGVTEIL